ncbi:hypothetical protein DFH08DRAFT_115860 [Mycena albidolilacea]|uniref:Uncharacterized protein n=1 Tax=Mycena albidolilacea TaxID=1033008 RepID=A0AAD7A6S1_9AGAR|nr:hypothetical protein DFH08DRAFT_115860 [Mycena albidolilacea]
MSTAIQMERLGSNPLHTRANTLPLDQMEQGQEQNMRPSEERDSASQERRVAITAWRLLNTIAILAVGSYKAATMNMVQTPGLTRVDWIVAAIWGLCAYWGGVIEQQVPTIAPWLFLRDFSGVVWFILQIPSKVVVSPLWYLAYFPYTCFSG